MIKGGIRARILLAAVIPLTVAIAAAGVLLLTRHAQDIEQHHIESSVSLARQAAILAELPLATGSTSSARSVADFIERSVGLTGLSLVDRDGNTVENRGNVGATVLRLLQARPLNLIVERDPQLIYLVHPVVLSAAPGADIASEGQGSPQRVGYVALSVSRAQERASVQRLWLTGAAILVVTLVLSLLLARWVARSVSMPMVQLSQALSRVARDDLSVRLPQRGKGEVARVASDFNHMATSLAQARKGLHDEVNRATEALARRTVEAEAASLAKSRYLAAASHDLRQPAHALSLYLAAARRIAARTPGEHGAQLQEVLAGMESSAQSLDSLLTSVLDISRIEAGVLQPAPEPIAIQSVFERVVGDNAEAARRAGIRLRARPTRLGVYADPVLFARICQNLVVNAIKFSERGTVLLSARSRGPNVVVQVWDQGKGIAGEHIEKIFDEFFQVTPGNSERARGMGLGLSIVQRLCLMQNGAIAVSSRLSVGSVFSVLLPQTKSVYRFQRQTARAALRALPGSVALVIDDEVAVRDATRAVLIEAGFTVVAVESLEEAERALKGDLGKRLIACVVDYRLGDGYTGIEVARAVRQYFGEKVKIVIVTGDTSPERLQSLRASGFAVQHKPTDATQLLSYVLA